MSQLSRLSAALVGLAIWELAFSTALFLIVFGLNTILGRGRPALRHALWGLVLLRLILPVDLHLPFSAASLLLRAPLVAAVEAPRLLESTRMAEGAPLTSGAHDISGQDIETSVMYLWLTSLWLIGLAAVGGTLARRRRRFAGVISRADPLRDAGLNRILSFWQSTFQVRRPVRLVASDEARSPFTMGTLRPVIFLPRELVATGDRELFESAIAHELAHIKRFDDAVLLLQLAITVLYFFNPIAWIVGRLMQEEREKICDELVISERRISSRAYGRSLVAVLRMSLRDRSSPAPALAGNKRRLEMRLRAILASDRVENIKVRSRLAMPFAAIVGLFLLPMASARDSSPIALEAVAVPIAQVQLTLDNPMPGARITSAFGMSINPFSKRRQLHEGIDLGARLGAPIWAPTAGVVEVATAEYSGGAAYGTVVLIDHGQGIQTLYAHLSDLVVSAGQRVERGDLVARAGSTGLSTGPHLHFEVRLDGEPQNPAIYIEEWAVAAPR